eukprot:817853-Rhodomonas_salina.1
MQPAAKAMSCVHSRYRSHSAQCIGMLSSRRHSCVDSSTARASRFPSALALHTSRSIGTLGDGRA